MVKLETNNANIMVQLEDAHKQNSSLREEIKEKNERMQKLEIQIQKLNCELDVRNDEVKYVKNKKRGNLFNSNYDEKSFWGSNSS